MDNLPNQPIPNQPSAPIPQQTFFQTTVGKITALVGTLAILLITLIILNYFNILPISPKLPHQPPKVSSQPAPPALTEDQQRHQLAQKLIDTLLQPQYRTKVTLEEFRFSDGKETIPFPSYIDSWEMASVSAKLSVQFDFTKRKVLNIDISLQVPHTIISVTSESIDKILSPYLIMPAQIKLACDNPNKIGNIQCNSMITRADETRLGISYSSNNLDKNTPDIINICQAFAGSNTYKWSACLHE